MAVWIREGMRLLVLGWLAVEDVRKRALSIWELAVASGVLLLAGWTEQAGLQSRAGGLVFGILVLCICKLSAEAIGFADGILILVFGVSSGLVRVSLLCFLSFLFSAILAGCLYLSGRIGKKGRIPFLPFLTAGYLAVLAIG